MKVSHKVCTMTKLCQFPHSSSNLPHVWMTYMITKNWYYNRLSETDLTFIGHSDWWIGGFNKPKSNFVGSTQYCSYSKTALAFVGYSDWWIGGFHRPEYGFAGFGLRTDELRKDCYNDSDGNFKELVANTMKIILI